MRISENGLNLIKCYESLRHHAYKDGGGVWTCGWGHTKGVTEYTTCDDQQAHEWLEDDLSAVESAVTHMVCAHLAQGEFDALCSFAFNLGTHALETSTLLRLLNSGSPIIAVADQLLRWNHDDGKVVAGLTKRRIAERHLFLGEPWAPP